MEISMRTSTPPSVSGGAGQAPVSRERPAEATAKPEAGSAKPGRETLETVVENLSSHVQSVQRNLSFTIDDSTGDVVVKVMDRESGELIRQVPSEQALRLSEELESLRSLLFEIRA